MANPHRAERARTPYLPARGRYVALAANRTPAASMATTHSTTELLMHIHILPQWRLSVILFKPLLVGFRRQVGRRAESI